MMRNSDIYWKRGHKISNIQGFIRGLLTALIIGAPLVVWAWMR